MSGQLVPVLVGLVAIGYAVYATALHRRLRREGVRVQGVVMRHDHNSSGESSSHVVVGFVDAEGASHEYRSALSGTRDLPVGRQVPMVYLPGAPAKARIDVGSRRLGEIAVPALLGTAFTAVGILWMVSSNGM